MKRTLSNRRDLFEKKISCRRKAQIFNEWIELAEEEREEKESKEVADRFRIVTVFTALLKGVQISKEESEFESKLEVKASRYRRRTGLIFGLKRWRQITKRLTANEKENTVENESVSR